MLDSRMMGGAFTPLRTYDLLWSPAVGNYVRGERAGLTDLMAWNADGTRMAYRMHSDYLHQLYLQNDLAEGRYVALGETLDLADITVPMFVVGTETDHVAPWRSVYKVGKLVRSGDYTFCLTSGGHNAGIISGPNAKHDTAYAMKGGMRLLSADKFLSSAEPQGRGADVATWLEDNRANRSRRRRWARRRGLKPIERRWHVRAAAIDDVCRLIVTQIRGHAQR
jgi:polyhydroxyalkanoate synthase